MLVLPWVAFAEADVDTVQDISVKLLDSDGAPALTFPVPRVRNVTMNLKFKVTIDDDLLDYTSWTFEIADPQRKLVKRLSVNGTVPPELTWDGRFSDAESLQPNRRYFIKLLLSYADGRILSSPWGYFSTRPRSSYDDARKVKVDPVELYVIPTGAAYYTAVFTPHLKGSLFPTIYGDLQLIYRGQHAMFVKLEASSNILFRFSDTNTALYYSDFTLGYRYRLTGAPIRAPSVPAAPPTGNYRFRALDGDRTVYGQPFNSEVGLRFFNTVLRGNGNTSIDGELARRLQGLSVSYIGDRAFGAFRFRWLGELGYSVFFGKIFVMNLEGSITYERWPTVAPGMQLRYAFLKGTPSDDPFDNTAGGSIASITNHLLLWGLVLNFKL